MNSSRFQPERGAFCLLTATTGQSKRARGFNLSLLHLDSLLWIDTVLDQELTDYSVWAKCSLLSVYAACENMYDAIRLGDYLALGTTQADQKLSQSPFL